MVFWLDFPAVDPGIARIGSVRYAFQAVVAGPGLGHFESRLDTFLN